MEEESTQIAVAHVDNTTRRRTRCTCMYRRLPHPMMLLREMWKGVRRGAPLHHYCSPHDTRKLRLGKLQFCTRHFFRGGENYARYYSTMMKYPQ